MNSKQNPGTMLMVGALSGTVGLIAFVALMVLGGYTFSPAFFLALLIAIVVAIVLLVGFHRKPPTPTGTDSAHGAGSSGGAGASSSSSSPSSASSAASTTASASPAAAPAAAAPAAVAPTPAPAPAPEPKPEPTPAPSGEVSDSDKPEMLSAAREGGPDDLKMIKGIGPKLEQMLHGMGIYHFDQIAKWTDRELAWVDANLEGFKGRASRDEWIPQAKTLAAGGETEFSGRVKDGDVY